MEGRNDFVTKKMFMTLFPKTARPPLPRNRPAAILLLTARLRARRPGGGSYGMKIDGQQIYFDNTNCSMLVVGTATNCLTVSLLGTGNSLF